MTSFVLGNTSFETGKMAATGRQTWEIVGKPSKKTKAPSQSLSKKEKKALVDNMPRLGVSGEIFCNAYSTILSERVSERSHVEIVFVNRCCTNMCKV